MHPFYVPEVNSDEELVIELGEIMRRQYEHGIVHHQDTRPFLLRQLLMNFIQDNWRNRVIEIYHSPRQPCFDKITKYEAVDIEFSPGNSFSVLELVFEKPFNIVVYGFLQPKIIKTIDYLPDGRTKTVIFTDGTVWPKFGNLSYAGLNLFRWAFFRSEIDAISGIAEYILDPPKINTMTLWRNPGITLKLDK